MVGIDVVSDAKVSRRIVCSLMTLSKTVYEPVFFEIFSSRVNSMVDIADSFKNSGMILCVDLDDNSVFVTFFFASAVIVFFAV